LPQRLLSQVDDIQLSLCLLISGFNYVFLPFSSHHLASSLIWYLQRGRPGYWGGNPRTSSFGARASFKQYFSSSKPSFRLASSFDFNFKPSLSIFKPRPQPLASVHGTSSLAPAASSEACLTSPRDATFSSSFFVAFGLAQQCSTGDVSNSESHIAARVH